MTSAADMLCEIAEKYDTPFYAKCLDNIESIDFFNAELLSYEVIDNIHSFNKIKSNKMIKFLADIFFKKDVCLEIDSTPELIELLSFVNSKIRPLIDRYPLFLRWCILGELIFSLEHGKNEFGVASFLISIRNKDEYSVLHDELTLAFGEFGCYEAITPLIDIICDRSKYNRHRLEAIQILVRLKANEAVSPLINIINNRDEDFNLRMEASSALGELKAGEAFEALINVRKNQNEKADIRARADLSLRKIGYLETMESSVNIFCNQYEEIMRRVNVFFDMDFDVSDEAVNHLIAIVCNKKYNRWIRFIAAEGLSLYKNEQVVIHLINLLHDRSRLIRRIACISIGILGMREAVAPLINLVSNKNERSWLRREAIIAIGRIGDHSAVEFLANILLNNNEAMEVRSAVVSALCKFADVTSRATIVNIIVKAENIDSYIKNDALCRILDLRNVEAYLAYQQKAATKNFSVISSLPADLLSKKAVCCEKLKTGDEAIVILNNNRTIESIHTPDCPAVKKIWWQ